MTPEQIVAAIVRPLEWVAGEFPDELTAGDYTIWHEGHGYQVYHRSIICAGRDSLAAAQAAAEADYRARIAAALDLEKIAALVEAGEPLLNMPMFTESAGDGEAVIMRAGTIRNLRTAFAAFQVQP